MAERKETSDHSGHIPSPEDMRLLTAASSHAGVPAWQLVYVARRIEEAAKQGRTAVLIKTKEGVIDPKVVLAYQTAGYLVQWWPAGTAFSWRRKY